MAISAGIAAMNNTASRWYYVLYRFRAYTALNQVAFMGENSAATTGGGDALYHNPNPTNRVLRYSASGATFIDKIVAQAAVNTFVVDSLNIDGANIVTKFAGIGATSAAQTGTTPNGIFKLMLGALGSASPSLFGQCDVAALFCGHQVLTTAEKTRIEAYVTRLYGLTP